MDTAQPENVEKKRRKIFFFFFFFFIPVVSGLTDTAHPDNRKKICGPLISLWSGLNRYSSNRERRNNLDLGLSLVSGN